ncbi:MAG: Haloacetate dehalogenase H-2 [Candidatus Celerinatantimonas neptuna]|nr:MAG: Haloacetate dehalogenase H-2 [Candidatus Celerinatantimonas neptuna]
MNRETILFDINETVLSLDTLKPVFKKTFHNENMADIWFAMLLHTSTVCVLSGVKTNFAELGDITLNTLASRQRIPLSDKTKADILGCFSCLKPHSDVKAALTELRHSGYKTVAFSNSSHTLITAQIRNAGLMNEFDDIVSVEAGNVFKPAQVAYQFIADTLQTPKSQLRLVSTHDWDTHGALTAGLKAAYINRLHSPYNPLYRQPDIFGDTMSDIVSQIINQPATRSRT